MNPVSFLEIIGAFAVLGFLGAAFSLLAEFVARCFGTGWIGFVVFGASLGVIVACIVGLFYN